MLSPNSNVTYWSRNYCSMPIRTNMKPNWHTGPWTEEDTFNLKDELNEAKLTRSLTNDEEQWARMNEEELWEEQQ